LNKWGFVFAVFGLFARAPHRIIREILGDSDEARYIEAGFYLVPTGLVTQGISQSLGVNPLGGLLMWVVGVILVFVGLAVIAEKHNL
jgi:hypothetical protein